MRIVASKLDGMMLHVVSSDNIFRVMVWLLKVDYFCDDITEPLRAPVSGLPYEHLTRFNKIATQGAPQLIESLLLLF